MGVRRKAGDDFADTGHLRRDDRHDRRGQERVATTGDVATDPVERNVAVPEVNTWPDLDFQILQGSELGPGEHAHVGDSELGVFACLRVQPFDCCLTFFSSDLEAVERRLVEFLRIVTDAASPSAATRLSTSATSISTLALSATASRAGDFTKRMVSGMGSLVICLSQVPAAQ